MINELDESLKALLVEKGGFDPAEVDISFEIPTRDWSTPATRPTVNLYLYDLRENSKLRETYWEEESRNGRDVRIKRLPLRIDLSYMITCWTGAIEDQHLLLWQVLDTFYRNSPLPEDILQGRLKQLTHPVRTEVAQSDGILKNVSDFWGALENQLRPAVNVLVTIDLDLNEIQTVPIVFARALKIGPRDQAPAVPANGFRLRDLAHGDEAPPFQLAGMVRDAGGLPVGAAAVRLIAVQEDGQPVQRGPTIQTDAGGRYFIPGIAHSRGEAPAGPRPGSRAASYTLVVEAPGRQPANIRLTLEEGGKPGDEEKLRTFVQEVVVPAEKSG
jgi:hypothetical protein